MPPEEREARNIPNNYNESDDLSEAEKLRFNCEREDYMTNKVTAAAQDQQHVLVICGRMHKDALAERFLAEGHAVECTDLLDQNWYIEDWMEHMLYNL